MKFRITYNPSGSIESKIYFSHVREYDDYEQAYRIEVENNHNQVAHPERIEITQK